MNDRKTYEKPELTVVKVKVERGFNGSQALMQAFIFSRMVEEYDTKATWGTEDNHFFD